MYPDYYAEELTVDAILEAAQTIHQSNNVDTGNTHPMVFFGLNVISLQSLGLDTIAFDMPSVNHWQEEVALEFVEFYNYLEGTSVSFRPDPLNSNKLLISR
jgi:hypothetical protein